MIKSDNTSSPNAIFLMGPTASGKTTIAIELYKSLPVELISVDSALIYKGMNIGTSKPNEKDLNEAPHRLLDIIDPSQVYSAENFRQDALREMTEITKSGKIPLLVGGSMFYFKTLLHGISPLPSSDPEVRSKIKQMSEKQKFGLDFLYEHLKGVDPISAKKIHPNDSQRIFRALEVYFITGKTVTELKQKSGDILTYKLRQFAIVPQKREILHQKIEQRFHRMLNSGFEEEVLMLFNRGNLNKDMPSIRCTGYRQMWSYIEGKIPYNEMIYRSICATRQLAKRQITWLRRWEKVHWLDSESPKQAVQEIIRIISNDIN